jgi:folate-binding protein YgfZ
MKRTDFDNRGLLLLSGNEVDTFLQGLVSNDVTQADGTKAIYSALLTPQGKFLYDFFMIRTDKGIILDCRADDIPAFSKKLKMYKLRSDVALEDVSDDYQICALFSDGVESLLPPGTDQRVMKDGSIIYRDPRLANAGLRVLAVKSFDLSSLGAETASDTDYQHHRISLGLPEAPVDLIADKSILLESGFDELHAVDWKKGCYMGQELTARTKYRGLIKKRLVPIQIDGEVSSGDDVMADGKVVGDVRSVQQGIGIAMIKLDALRQDSPLEAGQAKLSVDLPNWISLPDPVE